MLENNEQQILGGKTAFLFRCERDSYCDFVILVNKGSFQKKPNYDYSDIVPISFYTRPSEGDRESNYKDKIDVNSTLVGTFKLKIIGLNCAKFYKLSANCRILALKGRGGTAKS